MATLGIRSQILRGTYSGSSKNGCGVPGCPRNRAGTWGSPADDFTGYIQPQRSSLIAAPRKAGFDEYFLRHKADCYGLPDTITIKCRKCRFQTYIDDRPRWTSETQLRYVVKRPKGQFCHKKNVNWYPENDRIPGQMRRKCL